MSVLKLADDSVGKLVNMTVDSLAEHSAALWVVMMGLIVAGN